MFAARHFGSMAAVQEADGFMAEASRVPSLLSTEMPVL